jgi:hypothetical protein
MTLVTFCLGATLAVLVAGSASAAGSKGTTKKTTTTTTKKRTPTPTPTTTGPNAPAAHFFVINGTVNAASDHEIVGSSAFPNFTKGAVDNYYSMAHSHVDNSPFAEGTASPADTGPLGQTAAAGNTQQPQYADARWPGDPPKATYGSQGGPYATAAADEYRATADASEASNGLSAPGPTGAPTLPVPKGFDGRLRAALADWKSKWQGPLTPKKPPAVTTPVATVTLPKVPKPAAPKGKVTPPTATVTTPVATVTTPNATAGGSPAPPVTVPATLPSVGASGAPRRLASASTPPKDGETLLTSSTMATLDSKTNTLLTSGESSLGRVSLGGGAIVIEGIHVTASIANDGTPSYKAAVSVASATIGGVPVTIDQDGVHVAGQGAGLPFQQASDALNGALKQAGIQLFLVGAEVTKPCGQTDTGTGGGTTTTTTTTTTKTTTTSPTTTSSDQSATTGSCDQTGSTSCDSSGGGGGTGPSLPSVGSSTTTTNSNDHSGTTTTPGSCDQTGSTSCDQSGTTTNGTTTTGGVPPIGPSTTTTKTTTTTTTTTTRTSTGQTDTTTTPSGCNQSGTLPSTSSCSKAGTTTGTTSTSTNQTDTTAPPSPFDPTGVGAGSAASEETVRATGVHLVFTQPVNQSGVPAQFAEHILGEVFVDSLAVPAGKPPKLDLSSSSSSSSSSTSACGGQSSKTAAGGASAAGGSASTGGGSSSAGGSTSSGSASGSTGGSTSQPSASSAGNSLPAAFASALRKPLWLLLAYVLWQTLVIGTGVSLWNWRRDGAS